MNHSPKCRTSRARSKVDGGSRPTSSHGAPRARRLGAAVDQGLRCKGLGGRFLPCLPLALHVLCDRLLHLGHLIRVR